MESKTALEIRIRDWRVLVSLLFLLFANIIFIYAALIQKWALTTVLSVIIAQALVVAVLQVIKLFIYLINPTDPAIFSKSKGLILFGVFGFMTIVPIIVLQSFIRTWSENNAPATPHQTTLVVFVFVVNHVISFILNYNNDKQVVRTLASVLFAPLLRVGPLIVLVTITTFLNIIFPRSLVVTIVILVVKTVFDLASHIAEHNKTTDVVESINSVGVPDNSSGENNLTTPNATND